LADKYLILNVSKLAPVLRYRLQWDSGKEGLMKRSGVVVLGGLLGLGVLVGIVTERIRFDGVRTQLANARRAHPARMMTLERDARTPSASSGAPTVPLKAVDHALSNGDIAGAERAWRHAYSVATWSHQWRALADLGDAAIRIGDAAGQRGQYVPRAREAYFAALIRARADRSREGVTRMRHAFRVLGDHELAQQCAIIAESLPAREVNTTPVGARSASAPGDPWTDPSSTTVIRSDR
jgi:hypothetical protein